MDSLSAAISPGSCQWEDILRIIGSIHTGAVRAHDVIRLLSRDGRRPRLRAVITRYAQIAKSLRNLRLAMNPATT
ncbi:transposase [Streptomyces sp. PSAA01]|nr:transposase [Streptomyces sp. PSAA01]MCG0284830.1 transposase [Streptomyces sp. PSAA01]